MIGRGRVISLTPSGAHLGAGQELSNLLTLNPSKKFAESRQSWHKNRRIPLHFFVSRNVPLSKQKGEPG